MAGASVLSRNLRLGGFGAILRKNQICVPCSVVESKRHLSAAPPPPALAKYGGRHTVTMLPGHGIGPELMGYVKEIFKFAGVPVDFEEIRMDATNDDLDELHVALTSIKRNGVALKGNIETKINRPNFKSRNVELRNDLDLYVSLLHCQSYSGINTRHKDLDIIIIRQNTEGEYSMMEHENVSGVVECLKIITRENSNRIARYAFQCAKERGRKKVTAIHKANIMKVSDGLFLECCKKVAKDYPEIQFETMIIDNCCMQLVSKPQQFDVMVMPNLYGNIVSNVACGLAGGAGLFSGSNFGSKYAIFETGTRNTGSQIAGKNIANPVAMLNASVDLLEHLKLDHYAKFLREAISQTVNVDKIHTPDIGGQNSSTDVIKNVLNIIKKNKPA